MEQAWSTTLIPSTGRFWKEKLNDKGVYRVTKESIKSRVALLITNIKFKHEKYRQRQGAEKDEQVMEKLLTELGYEVVKHTNLTGKEIDDALIKFSKHPKLRETDSVFVVIMSHGKQGSVIGVDSEEFPIDSIYKHLDTENCEVLLDKPKIIIIQACRGDKEGAVQISDGTKAAVVCDDAQQLDPSLSAGEEEIVDDAVRYLHREKDFSSLLSCTPDTKAWRHKYNGSYLIQYIDEVVKTYAYKDHIAELFTRVKGRFENCPAETRGQMAVTDRDSLTKRFYLFPGH